MRIRHGRQDGSVLVIMIVILAIAGLTLGSYLQLVANQNLSVMRSMAWNGAISAAEAGIEEAMAHLNRNGTNRTSDGWVADGTVIATPLLGTNLIVDAEYVVRERAIGENRYRTYVSRELDPPVIYSEAYVRNPQKGGFLPRPRIVRANTLVNFLFTKGIVARGQIDLSGNRIKTDSFDSSDSDYSTDGAYDPAKAKDNGDVATNSSMVDSLGAWNAEIYGRVATGPGGSVTIGNNGAVGNAEWHAGGNQGIQPGHSSDDMNVQFFEVEPPFSGGGYNPTAGTEGGTNYTYVIGDGNWQLAGLSLSGGGNVIVKGEAVLYVTGDVSISGQAYIYIEEGASLQMYVAGANTSIGGAGVVNANTKASSFGYWGLPSNTKISIAGNAAFTGTIYAPEAALTLGGGGSNGYDFVGASVSKSVKLNGHFKFHYDEALREFGPWRGYTVASWNEVAWEEVHGNREVPPVPEILEISASSN